MLRVHAHLPHFRLTRGFSFVELMITLGIIFLVTGLALARYSSFNYTVLLRSQAYELALDVRQAQIFGISASGQTGFFNRAYGIYFDMSSPGIYQLFQDDSSVTAYRYNGSSENVTNGTYTLDPRFTIVEICNQSSCTSSASSNASAAFRRPNFDAVLTYNGASASQLDIVIAPVSDTTIRRTVRIYQSGQIVVQ